MLLLSLIFALFTIAGAYADPTTRYVPDDYWGIQQAILDSNDGDTIIVSPGLYFEQINFAGKNIIVTSEDPNDPDTVADTIINGDFDGTVVTFENGETHQAVLTGFTISEGYGTYDERFGDQGLIWGAGIFIADSSPTIKNNVICENYGPVEMEDPVVMCYGGGLACINSNAKIINNTFYDNTAAAGGAIMVWSGPTELRSNLIYRNSAAIGGGVVLLGGRLINCTVVNNDADILGPFGDESMAGNVYAVGQGEDDWNRCVVLNNIISNGKSGYGLFIAGGGTAEIEVAFNDIWGNLPADVYGVDPRTGESSPDGQINLAGWNGNISEDPLFVDSTDDEYHLLLDSHCINSGDPHHVPVSGETDMDGQARIYAVIVDMGADEYVGYIKPVADAGPDIHVAAPEPITLDGTGSYFYDPCELTFYLWTQIEGPALDPNDPNSTAFFQVELSDPYAAQTTFMPGPDGYYRFELTVSDDEYDGRPDQVLVIVGNQKPVADAGMDQVTQVPTFIFLDATESYDPDPTDELTYQWTQIEGADVVLIDANSAMPHFECTEGGIIVFELIVNDGFEDSLPATVRITTVAVTLNQQVVDVGIGNSDPHFYPGISGSRVVFATGSSWHETWDIKVKDLNTEEITVFSGGGIDTQPKIDGDIVVWAGGSNGYDYYIYNNIFAANIATGKQTTLRWTSGGTAYGRPAVSGNKVVWLRYHDISEMDWYNSPYDICGADISDIGKPEYFTIAENVGRHAPYDIDSFYYDYDDVIDISGDTVVWEAGGDIYGADISDMQNIKTFTICSDPARQYDPAISGNIVVWADERNDGADIYGADITDRQNISEFQIIKTPGTQLQPDIDGCLITYINGSMYGGNISVCCITKQSGILNVQLEGYPYGLGPAIDGDTIVYTAGAFDQAQGLSLEFGYSSPDGPIENVSTGARYDYIQHAIYAAQDNEHIIVNEGIHEENLTFKDKKITVSSRNPEDPDVVAATVIKGAGSVVTFSGGQEPNCLLTGFTISGGNVGIYCFDASPRIENCLITGNSSHGIELKKESDPLIDRCRITNNGGAGIKMVVLVNGRVTYFNRPTVTNSIIASNALDGVSGGGPTLTNCTITENGGRGIHGTMRVPCNVSNCIVYYNGQQPNAPQIVNSQATVTYSNVQGSFNGQGNTDTEPLFLSLSHWNDPEDPNEPPIWIQGDYNLLNGSPCIDAGDPNYLTKPDGKDLAGDTRLAGQAVDIGAYETQPNRSRIEVSQTKFAFETPEGATSIDDQLLQIYNTGTGTLNWQIESDGDWLDVNPTSGVCSASSNNVWIIVKPQALAAGEHTCWLTISDPAAANSPVKIEVQLLVHKSCFPDTPEYAQQRAEFMKYVAAGADPTCWCTLPHGNPYQCDGDADGKINAFSTHRVYTNDLAILIKNWRANIDSANPCADFDHKAQRFSGFRVFVGDLNILIANWKKTDEQLPGNCPRKDAP